MSNSIDKNKCPHCGYKMNKWSSSIVESFISDFQYICFNDECGYYKRGWEHTFKLISIKASYRYKYNPVTKQEGLFPVNNSNTGKNGIIDKII